MSEQTVLVNYRIAETLKDEFERYCRQMHISMTTQINFMMRAFIAQQRKQQIHSMDGKHIAFFSSWEDEV
jgi:hypothetical protein